MAISMVAYTELAAHFEHDDDLLRFLTDIGVRVEPIDIDVARTAGPAWHAYVAAKRSGSSRHRAREQKPILADFLIGAHAVTKGYSLLTRDARGLYGKYFPSLNCVSA